MYYKRCTGRLLIRELTDPPDWVMWVHHASGKTHCEECLRLDGCWFSGRIHPPCPHHPFCHCTLEPIDYAIVLGVLNQHGQRISIRIEIPRKNGIGNISFITGWAVLPGGYLKLATPYGSK